MSSTRTKWQRSYIEDTLYRAPENTHYPRLTSGECHLRRYLWSVGEDWLHLHKDLGKQLEIGLRPNQPYDTDTLASVVGFGDGCLTSLLSSNFDLVRG